MKNVFFTIFIGLLFNISSAQDTSILERLQAIKNNNVTYCNIDGYQIMSENFNTTLSEKGLRKIFRKYDIDKNIATTKDEQLPYNNLTAITDKTLIEGIVQNNAVYFVEKDKNQIQVIQLSAVNKRDKEFERIIVGMLVENSIPDENFADVTISTINFAGREITLGSNCYWTAINTVQCPYLGEMNWSVHKELADAQNSVDYQFAITASSKTGKVVLEEQVAIVFEGTETMAKKIIYDFKGVTSLLAGMSGGKTLTVFYVAAPVRGNYVSCVLSFWNNDNISETGLVPLLDEVMQLKQ
jgi:hypothetical protein